jgi:hypothetical protein
MDTEFHDCLNEEFTKAKREYRFGEWTPTEGPTITTMETVASDATFAGRSTNGRPDPVRS